MSEHNLVSTERVDDARVGPGLYEITCSCGWKSGRRAQLIVSQEFVTHVTTSLETR